ncbi:MAG: LysM peptidoglycan-binding domain-containing protein [Acidobacteria bacterium]|nr:MAG: LysM peptidoglycan-binding domain-containing protein [Acidobacteriota bacterium]
MKKGILLLSISFTLGFAIECKNYRVREGDTLEKIAKAHKVNVKDLLSANRGLDPKRLKEGKSICIPTSRAEKKEKKEQSYSLYEVKKGGRLEDVSKVTGIPLKELQKLNPELKGKWLEPGTSVKLPQRTTEQKERAHYDYYTVRRGGKLEHVAKSTGIPLKELEKLNPQLKNKWLSEGTKVKVPKRAQEEDKAYRFYTMKRGGTLKHVSKTTGVPLRELEKLNPHLKGKWLSEGTKVKIPDERKEGVIEEPYEVYRLKKGGRLEHVAKRTGVSLKELERLNPKLKGKLLTAGTEVRIPKRDMERKQDIRVVERWEQKQEEAPSTKETGRTTPPSEQREEKITTVPKDVDLTLPVEGRASKVQKGVEINAPCSSPVKAVDGGRVIYSGGDLQAYGNMVIVEHESFISLYAYNEENLVRRGERVSKGQVIAKVGKKNNTGECLLRFELRNKEGIPLDPTEYFKDYQ